MTSFIDNLNALRGNDSVNAFARRLGVLQPTLNNYMHGREPSVDFIKRVCRVYGVSADWLLGLADGPPPRGPSVTATHSTVAAFGGTVAGGDCSRCPLMLAAREAVSPSKPGRRAGK